MNHQKHFTIGRLAKELGVCTETIRYYHRIGLLPIPTHFPGSTIRMYAATDLQLLKFIKGSQRLGFSLDETRALIELSKGNHCDQVRPVAMQKLAELEKKMAEIAIMRDMIVLLLDECAKNNGDTQCPVIEALLQGTSRAGQSSHVGSRAH
jgi:MerR family mercuric resistance operon transcriptional regulator